MLASFHVMSQIAHVPGSYKFLNVVKGHKACIYMVDSYAYLLKVVVWINVCSHLVE